jgi:carboxyl-terminal processing protease
MGGCGTKVMVALRSLRVACAIAAFGLLSTGPAVAQSKKAAPAFVAVRDAFERIRTDYVDEVDDASLFRSAVLGMSEIPNLKPRLMDSERVRRALTLGSGSRNPSVIIRALEGVFDEIRSARVQWLRDQTLVDAAIEAMVRDLDPHSEYMNPQQWRAHQVSQRTGSIGLNLTMTKGMVRVANPIPHGPAEQAGLVAGDMIVAVDDGPLVGLTLDQVSALLRGPVDSTVMLTVKSSDQPRDVKDVKLVRIRLLQESVRFRRYGKDGYIQILHFNEQTTADLKSAVESLQTDPDGVSGYVIDLRDNAGGLLEAAIGTTEMLLGRGLIATTRGRDRRETGRYEAKSEDLTNGVPIVVLINNKTAAGAEVLAAALQESRRATVIGTQSVGRGAVQTVIGLREDRGAIRLTTSRLYTPSGRPLEAHGVSPDIIVEQLDKAAASAIGAAGDRQLQSALTALKGGARRWRR